MKKTTLYLLTILAALTIGACDDDTATIGSSIVPEKDKITVDTLTLYAKSKSIMVNDSILASTDNVYLGRYTDPETGTIFSSDFIAQFNCVENYGFPQEGVIGDSATKVELKLFYTTYFGDSLNTMQCEVFELDRTLQEGETYYTNIDPTQFYDSEKAPIATKTYCAIDKSIPDSIKLDDGYTNNITIKLPDEIGKRFIDKYYATNEQGDSIGKINFSNSEEFINNVFKGLYVHSSQGDGTVMYISMARLNISFDFYIESSSGKKDSVASGIATFSSTKEVLQVNRFNNKNLQPLADDNSCTYLKTPAGIFTEVELPVQEIKEQTDTLNSVRITFTRYNQDNSTAFGYGTPANLLMVRKSDMQEFFIKNKLHDNISSYIATFNSSSNEYTYNNIARLINYCANEYEKGCAEDADWESKNPDWNKVVLIPVTLDKDATTGNTISISHNHGMTSAKLRGGEKDPIAISIITSKFNNKQR